MKRKLIVLSLVLIPLVAFAKGEHRKLPRPQITPTITPSISSTCSCICWKFSENGY